MVVTRDENPGGRGGREVKIGGGGSIKPVHGSIGYAVRLARLLAGRRVAAGREDAVDEREAALAGALVGEAEPVDGAAAGEARVGVGGRLDAGVPLAPEHDRGRRGGRGVVLAQQVEGRRPRPVEVVVPQEGERAGALDLEVRVRRERRHRVRRVLRVVALAGEQVQRHVGRVQDLGRQPRPVRLRQRPVARPRVQHPDLPQHGQRARRRRRRPRRRARVVLDPVAHRDVPQRGVARPG